MRTSRLLALVATLSVVLTAVTTTTARAADDTGTLTVTVVDAHGAPVPGLLGALVGPGQSPLYDPTSIGQSSRILTLAPGTTAC